MAEFTPNFNLKKPNEDEFYNIEDFNGNMDIIDQKLKEAGQSEQLQTDVTEIKTDIGSSEDVSTSPTIFGKLADIKEMLTNKFSEVVSKITGIDSKIGTSLDSGTDTVFGLLSGLNSKGAVKSVQRGYINQTSTTGSIIVPISTINIDKAFVIITGSSVSSSNMRPIYISSISSDSFTVYAYSANSFSFSWEVIEFY